MTNDDEIKKINQQLIKSLENYRKSLHFLSADAPIGVLCLSKGTEKALLDSGFDRIYDLFDCDFTKIKGIGKARIGELTASLDKFISM